MSDEQSGAAVIRAARRVAEAALVRLDAVETIEGAYEAWLELKLEHAAFLRRSEEERRRLGDQGSFLVGAVRAAAGGPSSGEAAALARGDELHQYLREAETKLANARATLEAELSDEQRLYDQVFAKIRAEVEARVVRTFEQVKPRLRLVLRTLAGGRAILHAERVGADEAVLLMYALTGRFPTRYGFLFDDSTDDVLLPPQPLYPDEGVTTSQTRPDAGNLRAVLERDATFLPVKGFIPVLIPEFYRLLQRGPVMEVELADGAQFRSNLSREEAERFAGHLLRLKLAQKVELELTAG